VSRDFNGNAANFLAVGDVAAIDITGTDLTVACFVQFDAVALEQGLVTKWGNSTATRQYTLELLSSKIDFAVSDGLAATTLCPGVTNVVAGPWYHFCGVQNATDIFVYLNGAQDGTNANQRSMSNTVTALQLGKFAVDNLPLDGRLAEVGIWNTPLTAGQVASLASGVSPQLVQAANLRGYWPLCGVASPEPDFASGNQATINGTVPAGLVHAPGDFPCDTPAAGRQKLGWPRMIR
jgi:concanavalin A-like lectin/glucanase superfamily protein